MASKATNKAPFPILSGPQKALSKKTTDKAELAGFESQVDKLIEIKEQLESLESEMKAVRAEVQPAAAEARVAKETGDGACVKSVLVHGTKRPVRFTFADSFKAIAASFETVLRQHLGTAFDSILKRHDKIVVREGVTAAKLTEILGAEKVAELFEVTPQILVQDGGYERRAALRPTLTVEQNTAVDMVFDQVAYEPRLNTKG